ncbi:MAG: hypothetical protein ABSF63_14590 [Candidatus Bathyarchaeia archaeon]
MKIPLPPEDLMRLVCGDEAVSQHEDAFSGKGKWVVDHLRNYQLLGPSITFLDVGCGCGRIARILLLRRLFPMVRRTSKKPTIKSFAPQT